MRSRVSLLLPVVACFCCAGPRSASADSLAFVDSLWTSHRTEAAHAAVDSLLPVARSAGNTDLVAGLQLRRGRMYAALGNGLDAEAPLREAIRLFETRGDAALACAALRWLGVALGNLDRIDEMCGAYAELRSRAAANGLAELEAWGMVGTGYCAERRGDNAAALADFSLAVAAFADLDRPEAELFALNSLGNAAAGLGAFGAARASYERTALIAARLDNIFLQAAAANNLGILDLQLGDPGRAAQRFRAAADLFGQDGHARERLNSRLNEVQCDIMLGRRDVAIAALQGVIVGAAAAGYRDLRDAAEIRLARLRSSSGDPKTAAGDLRRLLAGPGPRLPANTCEAALGLAAALAECDSVAAALQVVEQESRRLDGRLDEVQALNLAITRGRLLDESDRHAEALTVLLKAVADAERYDLVGSRLQALSAAAGAARGTGRDDQALALLERAREAWQVERGLPADPEWREIYGAQGRLVATELAGLILAGGGPDAAARAFASLQVFKARTFGERMLGPGVDVGEAAPIDLATLQHDVLAAGEVFLDCSIGPHRAVVFAVTRDECRVVELTGDHDLGDRLRRLHRLLSDPARKARSPAVGSGSAALARTCALLGQDVFGSFADLLAASSSVVFCPDGAFNLVPEAALLPGPDEGPAVRLQRVPSAQVLADLRRRAVVPRAEPGRIAVLSAAFDGRGNELPGVVQETAQLAAYGAVPADVRRGAKDWTDADILHVAAHATADDQAPWRSRIDLGAEAGSAADSLDARTIAGLDLRARLAVLAACETAGGRILSGEGVQGLGSAFLAAGVPAVLATLWPVDDEATFRLTASFYASLANGADAATALRSAQAELAAQAAWADPFFWSGYVLLGDGGVAVPLRSRPRYGAWLAAGGVVAAAAVTWAGRRHRRFSGRAS